MNKIKKLITTLLLCISLAMAYNGSQCQVQASGGIGNIEEFNVLHGDAKYLGVDYRDNYYLDVQKCGLLDALPAFMNSIANILFGLVKGVALLVCALFYRCMSFNIAELFADQVNAIQLALKDNVFSPLLILALCGTSWMLVKQMIRRNLVGSFEEMGKVIFVIIISALIVEKSSVILTSVTSITKSFSVAALTGINNKGNSDIEIANYAAEAAGVLWINMVHEVWLDLEFGDDPDKLAENPDIINKFLNKDNAPSSSNREKLIEVYAPEKDKNVKYFEKTIGGERVGNLLVYIFPFIIKCAIYIVLSVIQICFQILALLFFLLAPLVLLLAMLPGYGMDIINVWLKKILETQISIFIITLALGLLIKCDSLLFALSDTWGYMIVMVFQIAAAAGLFLGRDKILNAFTKIQKGMNNPAYMAALLRNSGNARNIADTSSRVVKNTLKTGGRMAAGTVTTAVAAGYIVKKGILDPIRGVGGGEYATGRIRPNLSDNIEKNVKQQEAIAKAKKSNTDRKLQKKFMDSVGSKVYKAESFAERVAHPRPQTDSETYHHYSSSEKTNAYERERVTPEPEEAGTGTSKANSSRTVKEAGENFRQNSDINISATKAIDLDVTDSLNMKKEDAKKKSSVQASNKVAGKDNAIKGEKRAAVGSSYTPEMNISQGKSQNNRNRSRPITDISMSDETKQMLKEQTK